MICPICNTPNRDDAKFCKGCGRQLRTDPVQKTEIAANAQEAPTVVAPAPGSVSFQPDTSAANAGDDPALAPTLILTPERMMAYHHRRWQQEADQEQQGTAPTQSANDQNQGQHIEDMPTMLMAPPAPQGDTRQEESQDLANAPTVFAPVVPEEAPVPIPPPPPPPGFQANTEGEAPVNPTLPAGANETPDATSALAADATTTGEEGTVMQQQQPPTEQPAAADQAQSAPAEQPVSEQKPAGDFPLLESGAVVSGRYAVNQVASEDAHEHVYQVTDQQGYQRCWNCNSEQNSEGDEFCIDCGAELLGAPYIMHEYSSTESSEPDASVLQGNIVNTFVAQGRTYAIEQVQADRNAFPDGVHVVAAAHSDAGNIRRDEPNEDSTLVLLFQRSHESNSLPMGVFMVADGMGGHDNGQLASRMVVNVVAERIARELLGAPLATEREGTDAMKLPDEDTVVQLFHGAIQDANNRLCQVNQQNKTDMGSTVTGFMIVGNHSYIINVGDSRTYMIRGGQRYQLTTDHSLVGQLVAGGLIQPEDVYTHPQRSQIFRSLGDKPNVQIDLFKQELYPGDIVLSCSDGLWEMVRDPQIESILNTASDPQTACIQLVEAANANGGEDNISAVVAYVR